MSIDIQTTEATVNNDKILTENAFEAPKDGQRYSRRDGEWVLAYYYGDFAVDVPTNPQEGDLFFEYVN